VLYGCDLLPQIKYPRNEGRAGVGGEVTQTTYTYMNKCENKKQKKMQ
jgi:hypothetical protein